MPYITKGRRHQGFDYFLSQHRPSHPHPHTPTTTTTPPCQTKSDTWTLSQRQHRKCHFWRQPGVVIYTRNFWQNYLTNYSGYNFSIVVILIREWIIHFKHTVLLYSTLPYSSKWQWASHWERALRGHRGLHLHCQEWSRRGRRHLLPIRGGFCSKDTYVEGSVCLSKCVKGAVCDSNSNTFLSKFSKLLLTVQ